MAVLSCSLTVWCACGVFRAGNASPKAFTSPEEAARELVRAAEANDVNAMGVIFGEAGKPVIDSGDPVQDKNQRSAFAAKARQSMKIHKDDGDQNKALILIGDDEDPFAVPLRCTNNRWHFDVEAGRQELLARRIGANELDAIDVARGFVEAQEAYALADPDGTGIAVYADRFISSPGKKDGLYWPDQTGAAASPISARITKAAAEGYTKKDDKPVPYHGYYYKILKGQGPHARGGARDYVQNGLMIGGFAMLAWPADYASSGVKSFLVNRDGTVYEKDLGPKTAAVARDVTLFDPDSSWSAINN
jgi:hypothetical protein